MKKVSLPKTTIRLAPETIAKMTGSSRRAFVVVLSGDRMGEMFPLKRAHQTTVGRGVQTDVCLNDEGISRVHALIEEENGTYYLSDAGSTNGTYANGHKVERYALKEGDKVQIGATSVLKFTFHDDYDEEHQRQLYESALRDKVTGIFNRGYFNNRIESDVAFALRHGKPLALILFDIDHFKKVNDTHGHVVGDEVLRAVADRVQSTTRSEDILARYGGEEFALICRDVDSRSAMRAAERIRAVVANEAVATAGTEVCVTVSLGIADLALLTTPDARRLVEAADSALYAAKRGGRDRVQLYDPQGDPTRLV